MTGSTIPTANERTQFDSDGFLLLERFLPPDRVAMLVERVELAVARRREFESKGTANTGMTNINGDNTRLFYILDDNPAFLDLMDDPLIMPYITDLLHEKPHFAASDANWETEEGTGGFWWHIDGHDDGYRKLRPHIPLLQLKVGYYLTDMTEPNQGNLMLVPGSHQFTIDLKFATFIVTRVGWTA